MSSGSLDAAGLTSSDRSPVFLRSRSLPATAPSSWCTAPGFESCDTPGGFILSAWPRTCFYRVLPFDTITGDNMCCYSSATNRNRVGRQNTFSRVVYGITVSRKKPRVAIIVNSIDHADGLAIDDSSVSAFDTPVPEWVKRLWNVFPVGESALLVSLGTRYEASG